MADYKRMVSYMYQYENGVKRKNVGFAKIEAKGGLCKFTLHMQLLGQLDSIFPTYLIQRSTNNLELVYLGDAVLKNQVMDSRLTAEENNIMGTGYNLSDMGGILLFLHDNIFFATEWDDKPVVADEVLAALRPRKNKSVVHKDMVLPENNETLQAATQDAPQGATQAANKSITQPGVQPATKTVGINRSAFNSKPTGGVSLTLEEELRIPKYKLPGGFKMIERLQAPYAPSIVPAEIQMETATRMMEPTGTRDLSEEMKRAIDRTTGEIDNKKDLIFVKGKHVEESYSENLNMEPLTQESAYRDSFHVMPGMEGQSSLESQPSYGMPVSNQWEEENSTYEEVQPDYFEEGGIEESSEEQVQEETLPDPLSAQQFFTNYPRIYPFEDNEIALCVKIEPKDIALLPKNIWPYSNNSFLMHGFYCYHHLIFAKMKNRYGNQYILGVPGIFHNREQFMAKMFGFDNFKSMKKRELKQGDFGYWFLPVVFQ